MAELVKIQLASSNYQGRFEPPYIGFISHDRARAFEAVFTALLPFNIRLADTEFVTAGTPAEHKTIFKIPERGISFEFGAEEYRFNKELSSWATANEDARILFAAEQALMQGRGAKIASCRAIVAMHLQLLNKPREEILAPFISEPLKALVMQRLLRSYATQFIFADGDVLLDFSVAVANAIFLRFSSRFNGHPPLSEVLAKVRSDQITLFGILGVEEAANA